MFKVGPLVEAGVPLLLLLLLQSWAIKIDSLACYNGMDRPNKPYEADPRFKAMGPTTRPYMYV